MTRIAEPERELIRRVLPFGAPAVLATLLLGSVAAGWDVGWSAAIGVTIVLANAAANAFLLVRAARISLTAYSAAVMGGFVVRLAVIVGLMFGLNQLDWFSPLAFGLAVVPATMLLLAYEMKLMAGGVARELTLPAPGKEAAR